MLKDRIEDSLKFNDALFLPGHSKFTDAELKEILNGLSKEQLDKDILIWSMEDQEFHDEVDYNYMGNVEIAKASDELNDENATYFII